MLSLTNKIVNMTWEECIVELAEMRGLDKGEKEAAACA